MSASLYLAAFHKHLHRFFRRGKSRTHVWDEGRLGSLVPEFHVVEIAPGKVNSSWVYVTAGLGWDQLPPERRCEFLVCSGTEDFENVKLLNMLAWYHASKAALGVGHLLKIGRPWTPGSCLTSVLVSRLWQFSEKLEVVRSSEYCTHIYWVLPITEDESAYALAHGFQALEQLFEDHRIAYTDPGRESVLTQHELLVRRVDT